MSAPSSRKILHLDMDAFFASVEQRDFPELKGKPLVVGGNKSHRGVVAAASYEARKFGVHSAMSMAEALRLCPQLLRQPHRMDVYIEASNKVRDLFHELTEKVEPLSIDEAFLDVTETSLSSGKTATRLAYELKARIFEETQLTASAGVASNKFLAKVASDMNKPDGLTVVQPHEVQDFLDPLPVKKIWGVGPTTAKRMHRLGIKTIGELRTLSLSELARDFGKSGLHFHRLSRGLDNRPVQARGRPKSLSTESTFSQDVSDPLVLREHIRRQSSELSIRLEKAGLKALTVILKLRYSDFETVTRSKTIVEPFREPELIESIVLDLLERTEYRENAVRLLGVGTSGFSSDDAPLQLTLFDPLNVP